ncbi:MAG: thiamine-phosphate kinase [Bacteroidetes bacterium]|nr:MAG: thiamine-phosphate kinase [Bacteroidota bacterium]MBL1143575.1 thiamine-phosphate kinase [Bacteroidota bacterium]NOG56377.1 thiamine-phosphate kinase [Bacteroidota bacterium]
MIEENKEPTPLTAIGEFGLIETLTKNIELRNKSSVLGIGDDAAIIAASKLQRVVSTDMLIEGVHFDLLYTPLKHLGYKAVVVNLSDIYAMNAIPKQITVSIAVSNRMSIEALEEIYSGIYLACEIYNVDLVGGDTTSSLSGLVISVTAIGEAEEKKIVRRSGAKENDLICVTGDLGAAYMGLQILEREKAVFKDHNSIQPDFSGKDYILERQLKPEARKEIIEFLAEQKIMPTSMIDVSDGLSSELIHLAKSSGVGIQIYEEKLPIDVCTVTTADELQIDATIAALNGGEDYELLFTIPLEFHNQVKHKLGITIIGHVTDKSAGYHMVAKGSESMIPLTAQGWNHGA